MPRVEGEAAVEARELKGGVQHLALRLETFGVLTEVALVGRKEVPRQGQAECVGLS
ncbi:hypothetical protein GCM10020000_82290 [Streptomyces olivoverticillatus]